jgi:hypothetical protein
MGNNDYEIFLDHQDPIIMSREDIIELNHEMLKTLTYSANYKNPELKGLDEEYL